jgi:hypothetical protein
MDPKGTLPQPGALVNRRAADRLRSGYLWVYASDIESIELPEADAATLPHCCRWPTPRPAAGHGAL